MILERRRGMNIMGMSIELNIGERRVIGCVMA